MAVLSLLARLGTSQPVVAERELTALVAGFDLATFGRAPAKFDEAELERLNAQIVHQLEYAEVAERLPEGMDDAGWHAIRPNLGTVREAGDYWRIVTGPVKQPAFGEEDRAFLNQAAALASELEWSTDPWKQLTSALKERTGRKGKPLFLPLRLALTRNGPRPRHGRTAATDRARQGGGAVGAGDAKRIVTYGWTYCRACLNA